MVSLSILERAAAVVAPFWREVGLEPAPYAGAFEGLYVDVVPPLLAEDRPLVSEHPAAALGGETTARPPPWLDELPRPLVYATMGTVFNRPALFAPTRRRARGRGRRCARSRSAATSIRRRSAPCRRAIRVERFVPQAQVLPAPVRPSSRTAGRARSLGALAAGLPLVLIPQGADQFENAARCERAGAAVVLPPGRGDGEPRCAAPCGACSRSRRIARGAPAPSPPRFAEMGTPDEAAAAVEEHVGAR